MSEIKFEIINQKKIFTIFSKADSKNKQIVIMSHGFRSSSIGPARSFVVFEQLLNKNGISTLRFDQPHSGNSQGNYLDSSFNEWVQTIEYLTNKYLSLDYKVALLGQSMGASATLNAATQPSLKNKIPCLLLWVPDPKKNVNVDSNKIYEEAGQKYPGSFWIEAQNTNFLSCLDQYRGKIHLVYGEKDRYVSQAERKEAIAKVKNKKQEVMILPNQDHSPWEFSILQKVCQRELKFIKNYLK